MACTGYIFTVHPSSQEDILVKEHSKTDLTSPPLPSTTPPLTIYNFAGNGNLAQGESIYKTANNQVRFIECEEALEKKGHVDLGPG